MQDSEHSTFTQTVRTFFTFRYALPGYTFILIVVLVAYPNLQDIFLGNNVTSLVAAFLAFFSLLGGGAVGFLVSQFWYMFDFRFRYGRYGRLLELRKDLEKLYWLRNKGKDYRYDQVLFLDHMLHSFSKGKFKEYAERRYDLMHTCGSTLFATVLGYGIGFLIRIGCFNTHANLGDVGKLVIEFLIKIDEYDFGTIASQIKVHDITAFIIVVVLAAILCWGLQRVAKEHARVVDLAVRTVIKSGKFEYKEARKVFPQEYFRRDAPR